MSLAIHTALIVAALAQAVEALPLQRRPGDVPAVDASHLPLQPSPLAGGPEPEVALRDAADDSRGQDAYLEAVIVEGRSTSRMDITRSGSDGVTGPEQLERRPLLRPGELLETVPGVIVTQHSGSGKGNQFFLRGFNLDHGTDFLVTIGGVPINLRSHGHGQGYVDMNFMIPELVETVAYRKGPYFPDTGDFSSAGSVTVDYVRDLPNGVTALEVGQYGFQRALFADAFDLGSGRLITAVETLHHDGPWEVEENFRKVNGFARYVEGDADNGFDLTLGLYDGEWSATDQVPERAVRDGVLDRFGSLDPTDGGSSRRFSLTGRWFGAGEHSDWSVTAYAYRSELDLYSNFTYFLSDPVNGDQIGQTDERWVQGLSAQKTEYGEAFGVNSEWTYGLQFRNDLIDNGLFNTSGRSRVSTVRRDDIAETSLGLFTETTQRWSDRFRSTMGVRGDGYAFDVTSDDPTNSDTRYDFIASPSLGLAYRAADATELYLNAGFGFHSNDARGVTIRDDPTTSAALDGERVPGLVRQRGVELGIRHEDPNGLTSTVALWGLRSDSELLFVGDGGNTEPTGATERFGIEWTNYFQMSEAWSLDCDATWSRARFTDGGDDDHVPGAIESSVAAGLAYTTPNGHYAALRARYFGPRDLEESGAVRSSTSLLVNAHAAYRINEDVMLRLSIFNLFDRRVNDIEYYYPSLLSGEAAGPDDGGYNDVHFHPAEPLSIRVGVSVAF
ncbi:MAG: TonB-dependent receptor [Planctomycetota bacterium]